MESEDFKSMPTHFLGETYINPKKLREKMASEYGRENFRIKLRCGVFHVYVRQGVDDKKFAEEDWDSCLVFSVKAQQKLEKSQPMPVHL